MVTIYNTSGVQAILQNTSSFFASLNLNAFDYNHIVSSGQTVVENAYCGVLGDTYKSFKNSWCTTAVTAFSVLPLLFFLLALLLIASGCASLWLKQILDPRLKRIHPAGVEQSTKAKSYAASSSDHDREISNLMRDPSFVDNQLDADRENSKKFIKAISCEKAERVAKAIASERMTDVVEK